MLQALRVVRVLPAQRVRKALLELPGIPVQPGLPALPELLVRMVARV